MNPERFAHLVAAYGADLRRWPASERAAAKALLARDAAAARQMSEAADLDRLLQGYAAPPPGDALRRRILERAPGRRPMRQRLLVWWAAGMTTVGAAGALAGALLIAVAPLPTRDPGVGWIYDQTTAFGDLNPTQDS